MPPLLSTYPDTSRARDEWITARRGPRNLVDPFRPYAFFVEQERSAAGEILPTATVFLTNRECPWRCAMCDLWRNTLTESVPEGAIPEQIDYALQRLPVARQIKLYNSGSFFDPRAIPPADYPAIASRINRFERVIVESHPALLGKSCLDFAGLLGGKLEVAMGLETVHGEALARLNKRMTKEQFASGAQWLRQNGIELRVFVLVNPPFIRGEDAVDWAVRSLEFAFMCGATAASLILTRGGNGAMEELAVRGEFSPPTLPMLEAAAEQGVLLRRGRVFADLWGLESWQGCADCRDLRIARLRTMNLEQAVTERVNCASCGEGE